MTKLKEPLHWIEREVEALDYGVVMLSVVVHAGKIKRIEKSVTQKEQVENEK